MSRIGCFFAVVSMSVAMLRSSCIFRTIGGVRDTAKELETNKERLKTNAAKNFMQENIINFTSCRFFYEECAEKMSILFN